MLLCEWKERLAPLTPITLSLLPFDQLQERNFYMAVSHLSEDEQTLIEVLRQIALEKVGPRAVEIDHTAQFPWERHGDT